MTHPSQNKPAHISKASRTGYILFAAALLLYGSFAWYFGKIYIPSRSAEGIIFTGTALELICIGLFMLAVTALFLVAKSHDKRKNEIYYDRVITITKALGLAMVLLGTLGSILYEYVKN